jgi:hypothetical protein
VLGGLPLFCLVLVPVLGFGAATTGAGAVDVVTGADECVVVTGGAEVVVAGAEWVVVLAGLGLCAAAFLCAAAGFFVVVAVVLDDVVCVCAGVAAAGVEVVCDADVPPQPATARAAAMMLSSARFMDPASNLAYRLASPRVQDTRDAATLRRGGTDPWPR